LQGLGGTIAASAISVPRVFAAERAPLTFGLPQGRLRYRRVEALPGKRPLISSPPAAEFRNANLLFRHRDHAERLRSSCATIWPESAAAHRTFSNGDSLSAAKA